MDEQNSRTSVFANDAFPNNNLPYSAEDTNNTRDGMHPIEKVLLERNLDGSQSGALRAFRRLVASPFPTYATDWERPACPPEPFGRNDYHNTYAKPRGYVTFPRTFLPDNMNEYTAQARVNCAGIDEKEISDMYDLMTALKVMVRERISSKVAILFLEEAKKQRITRDGHVVNVWGDVNKAYAYELTEDLLRQCFNIVYRLGEDDRLEYKRIVFEVMQEFQIWYSSTDLKCDRKIFLKGNSRTLKVGFVMAVVKGHARDVYRNALSNIGRGKNSHGVILTISQAGGRSNRRVTNDFVFRDNVKGWDEQKHLDWKAKRGSVQLSTAQHSFPSLQLGSTSFGASPDMGLSPLPVNKFDVEFGAGAGENVSTIFAPCSAGTGEDKTSYTKNNLLPQDLAVSLERQSLEAAQNPFPFLPPFNPEELVASVVPRQLEAIQQPAGVSTTLKPTATKDVSRMEQSRESTGAQPAMAELQPVPYSTTTTLETAGEDVGQKKSTTEAQPAATTQPQVLLTNVTNTAPHGAKRYQKRTAEEDRLRVVADEANHLDALTQTALKAAFAAKKPKITKRKKVCPVLPPPAILGPLLINPFNRHRLLLPRVQLLPAKRKQQRYVQHFLSNLVVYM